MKFKVQIRCRKLASSEFLCWFGFEFLIDYKKKVVICLAHCRQGGDDKMNRTISCTVNLVIGTWVRFSLLLRNVTFFLAFRNLPNLLVKWNPEDIFWKSILKEKVKLQFFFLYKKLRASHTKVHGLVHLSDSYFHPVYMYYQSYNMLL